MTEYNERILKNVLEDIRDENEAQLLKEIEEAQNNPLFQNKDGEAEEFVKKYYKKPKKKTQKLFIKVAAALIVLAISLTTIPFIEVEGQRSNLIEIVIKYVDPEYIIFGTNEMIDDSLFSHTGEFIPGWIPPGYFVQSITESNAEKSIVFSNPTDNIILYSEIPYDTGFALSNQLESTDEIEHVSILGYDAVYFENISANQLLIAIENSFISITTTDKEIDLIKFGENLKKR